MKVALIHMNYGLKGGLETRLHNYIDWFLRRGDEVLVITSKIDPRVKVPDMVRVEKVNLKPVPKPLRIWFFNAGIRRVLNSSPVDYALSMGRTYVQDYAIAPNTHKGYLKSLGTMITHPSDWLQLYLDKKTFQECKTIFACSEMVKQEIADLYGVTGQKIVTAYPPLNPQIFNQNSQQSKEELKKRFGLNPDKQVFGFVSTSHQRKGLGLLKDLFGKQLAGYPIELAVAGSKFATPTSIIKPLGFVQDMAAFYHACDYLIHPAVYEPFGQVVAEALACGVPVIVSDNTGAKEVVTDKSGLVVEGFKHLNWKQAVEKAMNTEFIIEPDYVQQKRLTLDDHMKILLGER